MMLEYLKSWERKKGRDKRGKGGSEGERVMVIFVKF